MPSSVVAESISSWGPGEAFVRVGLADSVPSEAVVRLAADSCVLPPLRRAARCAVPSSCPDACSCEVHGTVICHPTSMTSGSVTRSRLSCQICGQASASPRCSRASLLKVSPRCTTTVVVEGWEGDESDDGAAAESVLEEEASAVAPSVAAESIRERSPAPCAGSTVVPVFGRFHVPAARAPGADVGGVESENVVPASSVSAPGVAGLWVPRPCMPAWGSLIWSPTGRCCTSIPGLALAIWCQAVPSP